MAAVGRLVLELFALVALAVAVVLFSMVYSVAPKSSPHTLPELSP